MGFISYEFSIFFALVLVLYWLVPDRRWQNFLLFSASLVFYGWLAEWHVVLLLASITADYFLALGMARWKTKAGGFLWLGVILNLALLASVKYFYFLREPFAILATRAGFSGDALVAGIILPLGVSFYTLKKISYLLEVKRGMLQPSRDFIAFTAYVSFFPQVFSGPIDRPHRFLEQLDAPRAWTSANLYDAWQLILMGLFKKIVVANTVKVFVDQVFLMQQPSKIFLLAGGLGFTLQILADFSSYTDLSRGIALLLGLRTSENFNKPYLSLTPGEFWNRWHMSFSFWLRDYVFFPLRRLLLRARYVPEAAAQAIPPIVTMFLSGLWHGTGTTFIVWGLYYGVLIVLYQWAGIRGDWKPANRVSRFFAWLVMFALIVFGWLIFRAQSMPWLLNALAASPFYRDTAELTAALVVFVMISFHASLLFSKYILERFFPKSINLHALYYTAATAITIVFINSSSPDFIYFRF